MKHFTFADIMPLPCVRSCQLQLFNMAVAVTATVEVPWDYIPARVNTSHEVSPENSSQTLYGRNNSHQEQSWAPYSLDSTPYIIEFLTIYFAPFLLFSGTLGNILSLVVFSGPALKRSATAFYFRALAIADTLALNFGLWPNWMRDCFGIHVYPMNDAACRIQTYLKYTLADSAVWVLVIMTIERMVAVHWPHHVRDIFTKRRTRVSVLVMVLLIGAVNIPSLWMNTKNDGDTSVHHCKAANPVLAYDIWPWVDLTIYSLLPFIIMISCIVVIINTISRRRRTLTRRGSVSSSRGNKVKTLTVTLLTVAIVFLLLTAPYVIYATALNELYRKINVDFRLFYFVASFLRYVNNSVNFFLYCVSGKTFRTELFYRLRLRKRPMSRYGSSRSGTDLTRIAMVTGSVVANRKSLVGSPVESPVFFESAKPAYPTGDS